MYYLCEIIKTAASWLWRKKILVVMGNLTYSEFVSACSEVRKTEGVNCSNVAKMVQEYLSRQVRVNQTLRQLVSAAWKDYKTETDIIIDL